MFVPSLAKSVPKDYGQAPGPAYLRGGKTCHAVMSLMFKQFGKQLAGAVAVTGIRVQGNNALALLGSKTKPARDIMVQRVETTWKIGSLLGEPLP
jgi:hypothetical protein